LFLREPPLYHKAGKAPGAITALLGFRAVRIKNAIAKVRFRALRGLHDKQLIKADAPVPIGERRDLRRTQLGPLGQEIDDGEVVPEAMHFGEGEFHSPPGNARLSKAN
jgi:hypothetical protein